MPDSKKNKLITKEKNNEKNFSYKNSGVDIKKAEIITKKIIEISKKTINKKSNSNLIDSIGLFSNIYDLKNYKKPAIITSCDGVGTKILLLQKYGLYDIAGWDLVAMNVNDVITTLAKPILFFDYIGMSKLNENIILKIIEGIKKGCIEAECILGGGETAELPDLLSKKEIELVGFCIGAEEKEKILNKNQSQIKKGDLIFGLKSNGFHSNGFSLIRKILNKKKNYFNDEEIKEIIKPTKIYWKEIKLLKEKKIKVKGIAHITGGGIIRNLSRIIPDGFYSEIILPEIKNEIINKILKFVNFKEVVNVFNMGIGLIILLDKKDKPKIDKIFKEEIIYLGEIKKGNLEKVKII
ncbi:MAG TPA: phosphoribosylformylglycinamidine cyclo-ligase [bacterium]|nr:phosphoribosylformylglycinamidine cyclo-ligase [bacterium]HOL47422.1 phosphoribosylformylglycinamidine cyclo-ligase [bacterium]HPQ19528.1 phosphoribosylformylglycinamidine cyclo-ligase [bacterium]